MKKPGELPHDELVDIVGQIRDTLYWLPDHGPDHGPGLDPDKDFEGDMLDYIAAILSARDLTPSEFVPDEGTREPDSEEVKP